jgi:NADH-quinone oxidoreductase subunit N
MGGVLKESLSFWWPEVVLSAGALGVILLGAFNRRTSMVWALAWVTLVVAGVLLGVQQQPRVEVFFGMIACDGFALIFRYLSLAATALTLLMIQGSREPLRLQQHRGEYIGLVLLIAVGLMLMAEANHLLMAYIGLELVGLSSYLLVGFAEDPRAAEASLKYLFFGALATALMLFGFVLLYGVTGSFAFPEMRAALLVVDSRWVAVAQVAAALVLLGLAYKISLVPMHFWTPDIYEGAPVPVAALLSVGPKAAGLALLLRLFEVLAPLKDTLYPVLLVLTVLSMTVGNVIALVQTNIKRLLAYSTIAQVGYILIGVLADSSLGLHAVLIYLVAYLLMNFGAFACLVAVVHERGEEGFAAFAGLAQRAPGMAFWCTLCLLSLAGLPPLLGFFGKFYLFGAALDADQLPLAIAGVVNSALALYYYVRVIRSMYLEAAPAQPLTVGAPLRWAVWACGLGTLVLGLFPGPLFQWLHAATAVQLF